MTLNPLRRNKSECAGASLGWQGGEMPSSQQLHPGVHCLCHLGWGDYNGLQSPKPAKEREGIPCWSPAPREVSVETVAGSPGTAPISEASAADPPSAAGAWGPPTPSSFPGNCPCAQMRKGDSWSRWGAPCCREVQLGVGGPQRPGRLTWNGGSRRNMQRGRGPWPCSIRWREGLRGVSSGRL